MVIDHWLREKERERERERGRETEMRERMKYILLYNLYYFNVLYCKIKVGILRVL